MGESKMVGEPRPWGTADWVAGLIFVFGFGALIGACLTMYIQQKL